MGFFDAEMLDMLDVYLLETGQLLERADAVLIGAEQSGQFSADEINEMFRIMHTMKSSSAMMGLTELSGLAHRLEDLCSIFREEPEKIHGVKQETFDLLFEVTDMIRRELERMKEEGYTPESVQKQNHRIDALLEKMKGSRETIVRLKFENNCRMENVRAFMAGRQIQGMCSSLSMYPEDVEKNPQTAEYIRKNGFFISFVSNETDRVLEKLSQSVFVASCDIVEALPGHTEAAAAPELEHAVPHGGEGFLNVRVEKLEELENLTGELVIAMSSLENVLKDQRDIVEGDIIHQLTRLVRDLGELALSVRMVSFQGVTPKISRAVRDICRKEKKEVAFSVSGQDTELDKKIVDGITEPLIHLIRNAIDHGIETPEVREAAGKPRNGRVKIIVENTGGEILIRVSDDGAGMDEGKIREKARRKELFVKPEEEYTSEEILELCLIPGFSTREAANEFSGRGVGLDVVRQTVESFGGHVSLTSELGKGTEISLRLPLTRTLVNAILVRTGGWIFALPSYQVLQFIPYHSNQEEYIRSNGKESWVHDGKYIPVVSLAHVYEAEEDEKGPRMMIHIRGASREACLVAEEVLGQRNIVEKALPRILGAHFKSYSGISGCSVLGDGSICMLLDVEALIRMGGRERIWTKRN